MRPAASTREWNLPKGDHLLLWDWWAEEQSKCGMGRGGIERWRQAWFHVMWLRRNYLMVAGGKYEACLSPNTPRSLSIQSMFYFPANWHSDFWSVVDSTTTSSSVEFLLSVCCEIHSSEWGKNIDPYEPALDSWALCIVERWENAYSWIWNGLGFPQPSLPQVVDPKCAFHRDGHLFSWLFPLLPSCRAILRISACLQNASWTTRPSTMTRTPFSSTSWRSMTARASTSLATSPR